METYTIIALVVPSDDVDEFIANGSVVNYAYLGPNEPYDEANGRLDLITTASEDF